MLTDFKWLESGGTYPPESEKKRIEQYTLNEKLFDSEHIAAFGDLFLKFARASRKKYSDVSTVINYQQLLSKKTADFVCGEPPEIETEQDTDGLDLILERVGFNAKLYEAVIDISRYGNAIVKFVGSSITAVSPKYWFPIVDETDLKTITRHIIAYPTAPDTMGDPTQLYAEIHDRGRIESRRYKYKNGEIGPLLQKPSVLLTGIDDFAVQVLTNVTHSGSIYGVDDYKAINSLIAKLMWRLYCIDTVLDKHSEPSISGPTSALRIDPRTGLYLFEPGSFFRRDDLNDPDIKYITWDGNLEAAYKEIDMLIQQLYTISEMGQAFMVGGGGGNAESGTALKLRMVAPRIKAARIVGLNEGAVKRIIAIIAQLNGIPIDYYGLQLHWQDGLPADIREEVETLTTATGGKPIMSQYAAMKRLGLSDEQIEAELEQLASEQSSSMPSLLSMLDGRSLDEGNANEEAD